MTGSSNAEASTSARPVAPISVAISTAGRPAALGRCLDALAAGGVLPAQVVIVDQSRDDLTQEAAETRRGALGSIVYLHQQATGLGASQNLAIASAGCPIVAVTDDDCIVDRSWLATILSRFQRDSATDAVTGRVLPLPADGDRTEAVSSRTSVEPRVFTGRALPWLAGSGNNFALKRDWFLQIGGCDERLGPGSPGQGAVDMDLFYRLLRAGARIRYDPTAVVYHERQTPAQRLLRRPMYGYGMGACCMFRLREGDWYALRLLGGWLAARVRTVGRAVRHNDRRSLHEQCLTLRGTLHGLAYGIRTPPSASRTLGELR